MTGADGMNRRTTETDMPVMQDKELTPQELVQYVRDICDAEALELMRRRPAGLIKIMVEI